MPHYFVDIKNGHRLIDQSGLDCSGNDEAIANKNDRPPDIVFDQRNDISLVAQEGFLHRPKKLGWGWRFFDQRLAV